MARRDPIADALPRDLYIEVTNRCNSRCQTCIRTFTGLEPPHDLTLAEFQAIVDPFSTLDRIVLHGIGEPLLNDALAAMIRHAKARHPAATVLFNSNAILLDETWQRALIDAELDEYRISLDAATPATYAQIRGIDALATVVENLRAFATRLRGVDRPRLSLWMMAMRHNLPELPAVVDLAAEIGVPEVYVQRLVLIDRGLARRQASLHRRLRAQEEAALDQAAHRAAAHHIAFRASGLTSPQESLSGGTEEKELASTIQPCAACYRLWTTIYITANGNVLPCCISPFATTDYDDLVLGNVFEAPLAQIWNNERYVERRKALYTAQPRQPCGRCGIEWAL